MASTVPQEGILRGSILQGGLLEGGLLASQHTDAAAYVRLLASHPFIDIRAPQSSRDVQEAYVTNYDGSDDDVETVKIAGLAASTGDSRTFMAWCRPDNPLSSSGALIGLSWDGDGSDQQYHALCITRDTGRLSFMRRLDGAYSSVSAGYNLPAFGEWYHVAVVITGTTSYKFYVNGIEVADIAAAAQAVPTNINMFIVGSGRKSGSSAFLYKGKVGPVAYYKRPLTAGELLNAYAGDEPTDYEIGWHMNNKDGVLAMDSSGNGHTGDMKGGASFEVSTDLPPVADKFNNEGGTVGNNMQTYSEDLTAWALTGTTVSADGIANPINGLVNADELVEHSLGGYHQATGDSRSIDAGETYTLSVYAKANAGTQRYLLLNPVGTTAAYGGSGVGYAIFDLGAGSVTQVSNIGDSVGAIEDIGNGWYRCSCTVTPTVAASAGSTLRLSDISTGVNDSPTNTQYTGDSTGGFYLWGAQFTVGDQLQDYQRTTALPGIGLLPRSVVNPTEDINGNTTHVGSVFPTLPKCRDSYAASTDGVDDRFDGSTNMLARGGNIIEMRVKIDFGAGVVTNIIASDHDDNNSTCFSPHLRLYHDTNELRFYGCRGAPFPYWAVDSSFYGVWRTLRFRFVNATTTAYMSIDDGPEVLIDDNASNIGDWGTTRNTYWAFGHGDNMTTAWVKAFTDQAAYDAEDPEYFVPFVTGLGEMGYDVSGKKNHGKWKGASINTTGGGVHAGRIDGIENAFNANYGFSWGSRANSNAARLRYNVGTLPSFAMSKIQLKVFLANEITSASTGSSLLSLSSTNGQLCLRLGSNTGLVDDETWLFNGNTSSRNYVTDTIPSGFYDIEIEYDGAGQWDFTINGSPLTTLHHSSSIARTCDQVWVGPSSHGINGEVGAVYRELKIWDDVGDLAVDIDFSKKDGIKDAVSGIDPNDESFVPVQIPARIDGSGLDAYDLDVTNPPGLRNGSETKLDIYNIAVGDNPCPASANHSDPLFSGIAYDDDQATLQTTAPADTVFDRDSGRDRLMAFSEPLVGARLADAENYTS